MTYKEHERRIRQRKFKGTLRRVSLFYLPGAGIILIVAGMIYVACNP